MSSSTNTASNQGFLRWEASTDRTSSASINNPAILRKPNAPARGVGKGTQVVPRWELLLPGEPLALDIEFQNYHRIGENHPIVKDSRGRVKGNSGKPQWRNRLGWIGIVNTRGEVILDVHVFYPQDKALQTMFPYAPGKQFGVTAQSVREVNGAVKGEVVEKWCNNLFRDHPVVFFGGSNDRTAFYYFSEMFKEVTTHDVQEDWANTPEGGDKATPGLAEVTKNALKVEIQKGGVHGPVEDAQYTMKLYMLKHAFDRAEAAAQWQAVYGPSFGQ